MTNLLRNLALSATILLFCALISFNAYVASKNLKSIQGYAAERIDASEAQSDVIAVWLDLQAIENGQRGYLLTGDESYLAPYEQGTANLPAHLAAIRSRLAARSAEERAAENELESVAQAKIADADETIRLRQKGYRHRAFVIVDSNRGKELMDKAHSLLASMSATEAANLPHFQQELTTSIATAERQSLLANVGVLALTVLALVLFAQSRQRVQAAYKRQTAELRATAEKLDRLNAAISGDIRSTLADMQECADNLQRVDGGFLPRTGQEKVQWIYDASRYVNGLLENLQRHPNEGIAAIKQEPPMTGSEELSELSRSKTA